MEICEILDDKIEVNLYSRDDIENYEIYVSYGVMYGIVYAHKDKARELREEIKTLIYNDYITNGYDPNISTGEFINNFYDKYKICIPSDIFFDEKELMEKLMNLFPL